ncbi:MAG: hypothetical protein R2795_21060 [Saprospiraceae bacterium]
MQTRGILHGHCQTLSYQRGQYHDPTQKVLQGGSGNWGEAAMTPHPDLGEAQARAMVAYILSLDAEEEAKLAAITAGGLIYHRLNLLLRSIPMIFCPVPSYVRLILAKI